MREIRVMDRLAGIGGSAARGERGAVATIVAVLLGGSVLFGCAALAVDVGSVMFERRQLQNGADAASLTLAKTCAAAIANCSSSNTTTMDNVTKIDNVNNTRDKVGGIESVCGINLPVGASLPACPTSPTGGADCAPVAASITSASIPYVEVRTVTREANGSSSITNVFSRMIGGRASSTVRACARAIWGPPSGGQASLPITVSGCDWQHASGGNAGGGGGSYYTSPVYNGANAWGYSGTGQPAWPAAAATPPAENPGGEIILLIQNPGGGGGGHTTPTSCPSWQGHALPGGFGLLETDPSDPCKVVNYANNWVHTNAGSSTGCDLSSFVGKAVSIPVFDCTASALPATAAIPPPGGDCTQGSGSNAWYHRQGYALFYLSGYNVTTTGSVTNHYASLVSGHDPCNGGDSCISGWFLNGELSPTPGGGVGGAPGGVGFGSYVVVPAG